VAPGSTVTLYANAWSSGSSDGDSFVFAYSADGANYTDMFAVANTSDTGHSAYSLPATTQGTVYVRVTDSDHSAGNRAQDTVYVDHLYIRSLAQPGDPPAAPSGLGATAASASQVDLTWIDNAADESGFQIERSSDGASWSQIDTAGADATSYADTTVSPNTIYQYRVRAYNGSGSSGYSNVASASTPDGLSLAANGYKVKGKQVVDLAWSGGSATSFDIYRDGNPIASGVAGNDYTDNIGVKGGGSYQYQVCEAGSLTSCSNAVQVVF
jgi:titin